MGNLINDVGEGERIEIDAGGFGVGAYTLFTYTGTLSGTPNLNPTPAGYNSSLNTNLYGQVRLAVLSTNVTSPAFTSIAAAAPGLIRKFFEFPTGAGGLTGSTRPSPPGLLDPR